MPGRNVLVACSLTALLFLVVNLAVNRAAINSVPRQTLRAIDAAPPVIGMFATGGSLVAAGFDAATVEGAFESSGHPLVVVNGALGATDSLEHLLLLRRALQHHTVQELVYGFFDQQMSDDMPLENSNLIGNHAMLYYEEPQIVVRYARFDLMNLITFQAYRCCAVFRERGTIWARVEKLRRAMAAVGMPRQETNRFGRAEDFDLLESVSPQAFTQRCNQVLQTGQMLSPRIQEMFQEAGARGVKIIVVEMPLHSWHVKTFYELPVWSEFRRATRQAVERAGASYIDASHWIPEESQFDDHVHLGPSGAVRFSRLLAERLLTGVPSPVTAGVAGTQ